MRLEGCHEAGPRDHKEEVQPEHFRSIYETSLDAVVVVDLDGAIKGFNPAAERIFEYAKSEVLGRQLADLLIPPRHRRRHLKGFAEFRRTGQSRILGQRVEVSAMRSGGDEFPAELSIAHIGSDPARYCAFVRDVTKERHQAQVSQKLAEENAQLLNSVGDGIYRLDLQGRITYANPAAAGLLGYEVVELLGQPAHELLHHSHADGSRYPIEDCPISLSRRNGEIHRSTSEVFWRKDGSPFAIDYTSAPIRENDEIVGAVCVFGDITEERERETQLRERATWTERIYAAASLDAFILHAQPIYSIGSGEIAMHELLVRMRGPEGELWYPGAFIPQAERFGLMGEIDRWVLEKAVALSRVRPVSVNLSATSLGDLDFALWAEELISTHGGPATLTIEITETAALANMRDAEAVAFRLGEVGCNLALDDFGTGYGSFSEVRRLPVSYLKIDRSFVSNIVGSDEDARVVDSIVALAKTFDLNTIAEGIEDQETLERVREAGVDFVQGFHLGKPEPVEQCSELERKPRL